MRSLTGWGRWASAESRSCRPGSYRSPKGGVLQRPGRECTSAGQRSKAFGPFLRAGVSAGGVQAHGHQSRAERKLFVRRSRCPYFPSP